VRPLESADWAAMSPAPAADVGWPVSVKEAAISASYAALMYAVTIDSVEADGVGVGEG